jgi:hypothetical protein
MKHYLIYYTKVGNNYEYGAEYIGDVTESELVEMFKLKEPDIESWVINEVKHAGKIFIV